MKKLLSKICLAVISLTIVGSPLVAFASEKDIRQDTEIPCFTEEFSVMPGETVEGIAQPRIYIGPEIVTFGPGITDGERHDYDGYHMGFEVRARYADGSTDGNQHLIQLMQASYGSSIPRYNAYYITDNINRKVADNVGIDQNSWYFFRYHNDTSKEIRLTLTSYSWYD